MHARRSKTHSTSFDTRANPPPLHLVNQSARDRSLVERVRPWCLAAAAALFVARPLWPSDIATLSGAGIPVAIGWLLLLAIWLAAGLRDGLLPVQVRWLDGLLAALVVLFATSGLWAVYHDAPRPAINVVWEWAALAAAFWLIRQLVRTGAEARALVVVMIALAVAEAGFGLHQYFVSLPADRAAYAADPDGELQRNGLWFEPGSRERQLFEQRLASTEPFGTFELANSLGGFLAVWLVVAGAAIWPASRSQAGSRSSQEHWDVRDYATKVIVPLLITAVPLSATLILCKSRSALLAVVMGLVGALLLTVARSLNSMRTILLCGAGVAVAVTSVIAFGWLTGALDAEVISEIPKSFSYRWEYWHASVELLRDHPWLGAGPGNFRDAYTAYKLPQASEEIADPHNFIIEVATAAGLPALLALLGVIGAVVWIAIRSSSESKSLSATSADKVADRKSALLSSQSPGAARWVVFGAAGGFLFAFALPVVVGSLISVPLAPLKFVSGLLIVALVVAIWWRWILHGELRPEVLALGACTLLVNFLAAGGIGSPAVVGSLWLLLALALAIADMSRIPLLLNVRSLMAASLVACVGAVLCYATTYRPVVSAGQAIAAAAAVPQDAEAWLLKAAAADPLDFQPWTQITTLRFARWQQQPSDAHWQAFEQAQARLLELRPRHSTAWVYVGDCYRAAARQSGNRDRWTTALTAYQRAVELYPNQALRRTKLAQALAESGDAAAAQREARQALELDKITPHTDQKLPDELRQVATRLAGSNP